MKSPPSLQRGDQVCPGLDLCFDRVVLVGRDPDGLPGEGDVVVVTRWVVTLELSVVTLTAEVADGGAAHRGPERRIRERLSGVRLERGDRGGLERDGPDPLPCTVDEVHSSRCSARGSGRPPGSRRRRCRYTRRTRRSCHR